MIHKPDGAIDWLLPAAEIARRVRAFNPWPSAFTRHRDRLLKIHRARTLAESSAMPPGTGLAIGDDIRIATGDGVLAIEELQLEGKRSLPAQAFGRGGGLAVGDRLGVLVADD